MILAALCAGIASCDLFQNQEETVSRKDYDELMNEFQGLREAHGDLEQQMLSQAQTINQTLQSLAEVSSSTITLRQDVESGGGQITQAERIQGKIEEMKRVIAELEKSKKAASKLTKELKATIQNLKTVIEEKEREIIVLKDEILSRDAVIEKQGKTIEKQGKTIQEQYEQLLKSEKDLKAAVERQAEMIYEAAKRFEKISEMDVSVHGARDRAALATFLEEIKSVAKEYYHSAAERGNPQAKERIEQGF